MVAFESYICNMLNFGIIGDIKSLDKYIGLIQKNPDAQIIGKSSVGTRTKDDSTQFTIPEFNRIELIDRSDALIINNFSLFPFSTLCDMVKKSKHVFATEYPDLSIGECTQLVKLTHEAKTIFQFINPFYHQPQVQWLSDNLKFPSLTNISYFSDEISKNTLLQLLLMLKATTGLKPKKLNAVSFIGEKENQVFNNLHFQFGDASVTNLSFGQTELKNEFSIKTYANKQFVALDLNSQNNKVNNQKINLKSYSEANEFNIFMEKVNGKNHTITQMEDYLDVLETSEKINNKLSQFSNS